MDREPRNQLTNNLSPIFADLARLAPYLEQGAVILTPNRRLARAVRAAEQTWRKELGQVVWSSSTVLPLAQYWTLRWEQAQTRGLLRPGVLIDAYAQCLLWKSLIEQHSDSFTLISPMQAARQCQRAHEALNLWMLDRRSSALKQRFMLSDDGQNFWQWAELFDHKLIELKLQTPEQAWRSLLEVPEQIDAPVVLLNADPLPALHEALLAASAHCERVLVNESPTTAVSASAFESMDDELAAAAVWCREQTMARPTSRFAVVLADMQRDRAQLEYYLRREFDCLSADYDSLPVNFATGFALDTTPLVRDALTILDVSRETLDVETFVALIQSAFVGDTGLSREETSRLIDELRSLYVQRLSQRMLRQVSQGITTAEQGPWMRLRELESAQRLRHRRAPPSQWVALFKDVLAHWGWPLGRSLDSLEYQQFQQWMETCERFAGLDQILGACSYEIAVTQFRALVSEQMFQPQTQDRGIQVLGHLETEGLRFDGMWLAGMDSAQWPASPKANPFLPYDLQKQFRMPHVDAEWEWTWAQRRWERWLGSASEIVASYVRNRDEVALAPTSFLSGYPVTEYQADAVEARWQNQFADVRKQRVALPAVPLAKHEWAYEKGGASLLEHQANCAFRAFAALRLRSGRDGEPAPGLLPFERGQILHRALYQLTGTFPNQPSLQSASASELDDAVSLATTDAFKSLRKNRREVVPVAVVDLEHSRLQVLLKQWLAFEQGRTEPYEVIARELETSLDLGGLSLTLRIDRVDKIANDYLAVLDYKTGVPESVLRWIESPPTRPQMPLYACTEPVPAAVAYVTVRAGEIGFKGIGSSGFEKGVDEASKHVPGSEDSGEAIRELRKTWSGDLRAIADDFLRGESRVDPTVDACRYCQRQSLCRVGDVV